eukprot:tig00001208_g7538.t1
MGLDGSPSEVAQMTQHSPKSLRRASKSPPRVRISVDTSLEATRSSSSPISPAGSSKASPKKNRLRVLLFGATVMAGFRVNPPVKRNHSAAIKLQEHLERAFGSDHISVELRAAANESTDMMAARLKRLLEGTTMPRPTGAPYEVVVICAGEVDLAKKAQAGFGVREMPMADLSNALCTMHLASKEHGCRTVVVTLPQGRAEPPGIDFDLCRNLRAQLNEYLRSYALSCRETGLADIGKEMAYSELSAKDRRELWADDGVHLSALGHDRFGEILYAAIRKLYPGPLHGKGSPPPEGMASPTAAGAAAAGGEASPGSNLPASPKGGAAAAAAAAAAAVPPMNLAHSPSLRRSGSNRASP